MALEVASLFATLGVRDDLTPTLDRAEQRTRSFADRLQSIGGSLTGVGASITALTAPITAFLGTGIRTASNFEAVLSEIAARTGLTADEMERVRQFALQMGADTAFSSQQAAEAFLQLLSSGQSVSEAFQTLPVVLDAAAASGEDLGRTADMVTDIMAAFGLPVDQARTVVDALARAAGSSSASMSDLGQGFSNVGNVARNFGLSVDETAAILAIFSENGIKGAEAGTQLRSMLLNMSRTTPSVHAAWQRLGTSLYDAQGQMRPLADVIDDIARATANMSDAERNEIMIELAGSYGILGLSALTGSTRIRDMQEAMASQTDAASIAAQRMDTFKGRMDSLAGSIETLQITALTPLIEQALKPLVEQAIEVVNSITAWVNENPELAMTIVQVGAALAVLGPLLIGAGVALSAIGSVLGFLLSPLGLLVAGIAALGVAFATNFMGIRDAVEPVITSIVQWVQADAIPALQQFADWFTADVLPGVITFLQTTIVPAFERLFEIITTLIGGLLNGISTFISDVQNYGIVQAILGAFGVGTAAPELTESWIQSFMTDILTLFGVSREAAEQIASAIITALGSLVSFVITEVIPALGRLAEWFLNDALPAVVSFVETTVVPALQGFFDIIAGAWAIIGPVLRDIARWFLEDGLPAIGRMINDVRTRISEFITTLSRIWAAISGPVTQLRDGLLGVLKPIEEAINRIINGFDSLRGLQGQAQNAANALSGLSADQAWQRTLAAAGGNDLLARIAFSMMGNPGARADGGPVAAHQPYLVGERGPELFVPSRDGHIVPNHAMSGLQIGSVTVHANTPDDARRAADAFVKRLDQLITSSGANL